MKIKTRLLMPGLAALTVVAIFGTGLLLDHLRDGAPIVALLRAQPVLAGTDATAGVTEPGTDATATEPQPMPIQVASPVTTLAPAPVLAAELEQEPEATKPRSPAPTAGRNDESTALSDTSATPATEPEASPSDETEVGAGSGAAPAPGGPAAEEVVVADLGLDAGGAAVVGPQVPTTMPPLAATSTRGATALRSDLAGDYESTSGESPEEHESEDD